MAVHEHGDAGNQSVGIVIPSGARQGLGIGAGSTIEWRCHRKRAVLVAPGVERGGDPLRVHQRPAVPRGGSLQVNVPGPTRRILGLSVGDRVLVREYPQCCEVLPINGGQP